VTDNEAKSRQFRRSIYFTKALQAGEIITEDCIKCCRPGYGLEPKYFSCVIGTKAAKDITKGERCLFHKLKF